jgi:hypothetical protein
MFPLFLMNQQTAGLLNALTPTRLITYRIFADDQRAVQ